MLPPTPNPEAAALISRLGLQPLPHEGGWFARTWTSRETLPDGRPLGTAIYFLMTPDNFSALHRLDADELWHFHSGDPVQHVQLPSAAGPAQISVLGTDITAGQTPQLLAIAGFWQGARPIEKGSHGWSLLSCTMTPGWSDEGFELASRSALHAIHPTHARLITSLTRIG